MAVAANPASPYSYRWMLSIRPALSSTSLTPVDSSSTAPIRKLQRDAAGIRRMRTTSSTAAPT